MSLTLGSDMLMTAMPLTPSSGPIITGMDINQGDLLGGEFIPIHGARFTDTSSVTFDGVAATSFFEFSDNLIFAIAPAGSAGLVDVVVTATAGTSVGGAGLYEYWDPSLLPLSIFNERGDFTLGEFNDINGTPSLWTARASIGTSGAHDFIQFVDAVDSPLEMNNEPVNDGVSDYLVSNGSWFANDTWTDSDGTVIVGFNARSAAADAGANMAQFNPGLVGDDSGSNMLAASFSDAGFTVGFYKDDGFNPPAWQSYAEPADINRGIIGSFKWHDPGGLGSYIKVRAGAYPFTFYTSTGSLGGLSAQNINLGKNYSGTAFFDGTIRFTLCAQTEISDDDCDKVIIWAQNRHGMQTDSFLPEIWSIDSDVIDLNTKKSITIRGRGFNGTQMVYIGTDITSGFVVDDNTLIVDSFPTLLAGKYTVTVQTSAGFSSQANGIEYYDALARTASLRWRVGDSGSRTINGFVEVTALNDTSGTGDSNMNLIGPGSGSWNAGASAPQLYFSDYDFGIEDSMGSDEGADTIRNMTTGTYTNPIPQPSTVYLVFKRPPYTVGDLMLPVDVDVNYADSLIFTGPGGGNYQTWEMGANNIDCPIYSEVTYAACFSFNTTASAAYFNDYFVTTSPGYTDGGTDAESSAAMGSHPSGDGRYKWATRIIVPGADSPTDRRRMMKWMDNRYQLGRSLRSLGPQLLLAHGDYNGAAPGTWSERRGHNMTGSGGNGPPVDPAGIPTFSNIDYPLSTTGWTLNDWAGIGDHHLFCAFKPTSITSTATSGVYNNQSPFDDDAGYIGFYLRLTDGIYYCDFYEWDSAERLASVSLGDTLGSVFAVQGKKEGGFLWIRLGTGPWIKGDACSDTGGSADEAFCGFNSYIGAVHSIASWKRVLTDIESDRLATIGVSMGLP